ncbi:MAG: acylneuraminate cytidylyltransferase family protein [Bacteroidota bacterium]
MKILGLIPARGGSKGVPRKNIRLLGGVPLLEWTVREALATALFPRVMVSTESEEIAAIARNAGATVPFLRPDDLASDTAKSIDVVIHALAELERLGETYDAVCLLQPTTPFRSASLIQAAIKKFSSGNYTGLVSVVEVPTHYNPYWTFIPNSNGDLKLATGETKIISRRQDLPPAFIRDGAIYLTKTEVIKHKNFFGDRLGYVSNHDQWQVNIDSLADWEKAEEIVTAMRKSEDGKK